MDAEQTELAEAAAQLEPEDLRFLEEHDLLPEQDEKPDASLDNQKEEMEEQTTSDGTNSQEEESRRNVDHEWPEVGAVLEADYRGTHYEAEVISAPRYTSGRAIRILTGPAAGDVERSMSGAMMRTTERQREENDLGRSGVSNGWTFWSMKEGGSDEHDG